MWFMNRSEDLDFYPLKFILQPTSQGITYICPSRQMNNESSNNC